MGEQEVEPEVPAPEPMPEAPVEEGEKYDGGLIPVAEPSTEEDN